MTRPSPWLLRCRLTAAALTLALAPALALAPGMAQTPEPRSQQPPTAQPQQPEPSLAGQPLYTSDGKEIGTVIAMGLDEENNEPVLVAEIAQPLGLGPVAVAVPTNMFVRKGDRIELTLTEAEVHARLNQ
jgi:hypothetical protein